MNNSLPLDDLPPACPDQSDTLLRRQLEEAVGKYLYQSCDGVTQGLLISCEWYISTLNGELMLVINCPDMATNWRILNNVVPIARQLERFSSQAKLRIAPPSDMGVPYEIRIDEISIF